MLSVLTLAIVLADALPQDDKANSDRTALEVLPMQHVFGVVPPLTPPPWGTMLRFPSPDVRPDFLGVSAGEPQFSIDAGVELLRSLFRDQIDAGSLRIDAVQDVFVVSGNADLVARVRDRAREAAELLVRPLQVEVALWTATGPAAAGVLDPREFAQATANRTPSWRSVGEARSGMPVALDRQRWTRYVRDASVEVAQKQSIAQPNTDAYGEGGRVVVCPHALVGGDDLVVFVQFGLGERRGAVRTQSSGIPGVPDLEVPVLETSYGACSARIRNGGALAVTLRGHASTGGQVLMTVRVMGRTPPSTQSIARLGVYPIGALTSPATTQIAPPPSPYPTLGDETDHDTSTEEGPGWMETEQLLELVRHALGADGDSTALDVHGSHLFVRGEEHVMPKVEAMLRGLQDRLVRTVTVRHVVQFVADGTDGAPADRTVNELVFPTLLGRTATVSRVLETNAVRDLFVEIAQEASMFDPIVETIQSGEWVRARAGNVGTGLHLALLAQCSHAVPAPPRTAVPAGGVLNEVQLSSTRVNHGGSVAAGQTIDHGDGPLVTIDGRTFRTTTATTLTW